MIITISRQFGSGGREVGKRLADALGLEYYDKQLVTEIAKSTELNENYVSEVLKNGGYRNYVFSFGRSIPLIATTPNTITDILVAQQKIIKVIGEKGDCVIVGRSADAILSSLSPVRIFVYADEKSRIKRCRERAPEDEHLTDKQLMRKMKEIDKGRRKLHELFSNYPWGDKDGYDLMLNTSDTDIKSIIPHLASLVCDFHNK